MRPCPLLWTVPHMRLYKGIELPTRGIAAARHRLPSRKWDLQAWRSFATSHHHSAKSVVRRNAKDLPQGVVKGEPLPTITPDESPAETTLLQEVRNNMTKFQNCVLLTHVGKFYELYFEQAEEYGPLMNLKVAYRRTSAKSSKPPVAMAGFPVYQRDRYLKILVQDLDKYVAICDQIPRLRASPEDRDIERRITRVISPGTLIDEKFLDPFENNYLLSICTDAAEDDTNESSTDPTRSGDTVGLAWADLSTGDFFTQSTTRSSLPSVLTRIGAREVLLSDTSPVDLQKDVRLIIGQEHRLLTIHKCKNQAQPISFWNTMLESPISEETLKQFSSPEQHACHQLLDYAAIQLQGFHVQLLPPRRRELKEALSIDRHSLKGLEILETSREGFGRGSLFHAVRRTVTKSGTRLLRDRLTSPSSSLGEIGKRLELLTVFHQNDILREALVQQLRQTHDVQRLVQKFTVNQGDPDEMLSLAKAVTVSSKIYDMLRQALGSLGENGALSNLVDRMDLEGPLALAERISESIDEEGLSRKHRLEEDEATDSSSLAAEVVLNEDPQDEETLKKLSKKTSKNTSSKDIENEIEPPWIMRKTASERLLHLHEKRDQLKVQRRELSTRLQEHFGPSLTLKWTPGLGHICHVKTTKSFDSAAIDLLGARMVSASKSTKSFYEPSWLRLGRDLDQAKLNIENEESRITYELKHMVIRKLVKLRRNAAVLDELDIAASFATVAQEESWTRPLLNNSKTHKIVGGRHPTVKLGLEEKGRSFVSNDLFLSEGERVWLVTGPNMAGKSTFLRQNALITILAQVGSYVPADHAEIGLVDQIFSRIGAADDLFRDQSTFMVEMLETAAILRQATDRSFVIMDEVGRGTTPEDGTAVGFACLHHLYNTNKCRTLFATHFHALADMTRTWPELGCYCTDILEDPSGSFVFMHKLKKGVNRQSHALKVARLAGLPEPALAVAESVLEQILKGPVTTSMQSASEDEQAEPLAATG